MTRRSERFMYVVASLFITGGLTLWLTTAFRENMLYFVSPAEFMAYPNTHSTKLGKRFRLGGLVQEGSIKKNGLRVTFVVADETHRITVQYEGITPELFREKQGVIAEGVMLSNHVFKADRLLAKHDERYMPSYVQMKK